jgi:hypothetical protein
MIPGKMIIYVHVHCTRYMHNRMSCVCVHTRNHKISVHPKKHEVQPSKSKSKIVVREEC